MKALILGMGNPILSDDGVGLFVAGKLRGRIPRVDVITTAMVGLSVLDEIAGYDTLFLIDAVTTKGRCPGELKKLEWGEGSLHLFSSHGLNLPELVQLGQDLGYQMPTVAAIYGIEIGDELDFGERLSPELHEKTQSIVQEILADIGSYLGTAFPKCDGEFRQPESASQHSQ